MILSLTTHEIIIALFIFCQATEQEPNTQSQRVPQGKREMMK